MSWLQPKRFTFSRAEFKDDDDAEAHWTAVGFTFPPVFCWRRAGCEMKRGIRSGAAHVESSHRQAAPHLPHSLAACLLPCSVLHHPTLTRGLRQRVLVSSINSRLAKHFVYAIPTRSCAFQLNFLLHKLLKPNTTIHNISLDIHDLIHGCPHIICSSSSRCSQCPS